MQKIQNGLILHDYFAIKGGGEALVQNLSRHWHWPVLTGFMHPSFQAHVHKMYSLGCEHPLFPLQFHRLIRFFSTKSQAYTRKADICVYSGVYAPLAIKGHRQGKNILYCHTPPRFIYDQRSTYLQSIAWCKRPVLMAMIRALKPRYEQAVQDMDLILANSLHVQGRIKDHLGFKSEVVYPPVKTKKFKWLDQEDFYLSTARLDTLKRVDLIIQAFLQMPDKKLVLVSGGREESKLRRLAGEAKNINFMGWVSDDKLQELLGKCIASIYIPRDEDFGISPVESMAAGKPVIGVQEGGLWETVGDFEQYAPVNNGLSAGTDQGTLQCRSQTAYPGKQGAINQEYVQFEKTIEHQLETECGVLVKPEPQVQDLIQAVLCMTPKKALEKKSFCEKRAEFFDSAVFLRKMDEIVF